MAEGGIAQTLQSTTLSVLVRQIRYEGRNILSYELVDPDGAELPPFEAGAHIDVHLGDGLVRQYSLCNAPDERGRYVIAVLRDERGRGGSRAMHERLRVSERVRISRPRNHFMLDGRANRVLLLAGGIGVTPLKSMAHRLARNGAWFALHFCARERGAAPFGEELEAMLDAGQLHWHFDGGDPSKGLDVRRLLDEEAPKGTHVYYCGPAGFMQACAEATAQWPRERVHCEHFSAPVVREAAEPGERRDPGGSFEVEIASTGQRLTVPPNQSIADVLREAHLPIQTSCESGLCGTCKTRYLDGEVDHRDCILGADEQREFLTACVSRATSERLVLDL
ncbi:PDR/VanB family oxidoreductase [Paraburkholderia dipogonis]|uniref:PDR/VanB family oxidoreductase n=1 Tax=Paraburkholderia dipogonis TaxID=1211383 RepID=UPI0038BA395D